MRLASYIPRSIKTRLSFETKFAAMRAMQDLWPSCSFAMNPILKRRARYEAANCQNIEELFRCAQRWLGCGPVQIVDEISAAIEYMRTESPKCVCEIGTESGGTSFLLSRGLCDLERLICVDLYVTNRPRLRCLCPAHVLRFVNGPSTAPRSLRQVDQALEGRQLDVLFIDGDHRFEGVKRDFLLYRRFVREGGLIALHDIVPDHGVKYGRSTMAWTGGVPTLWNQLKAIYPHREFVQDPEQDGLGIGILHYSHSTPLSEVRLEGP